MNEETQKEIEEQEKIPGTWAYILKAHWDNFSDVCWKAFNHCCEDMNKHGHENKIDYWKWRDYVLHDMQRRHEKEKNK